MKISTRQVLQYFRCGITVWLFLALCASYGVRWWWALLGSLAAGLAVEILSDEIEARQ